MTAAAYTTDITDITACESVTSWAEPTGFTDGGVPVAETDYWIQSPGSGTTHCVSKPIGTGTSFVSGMIYDSGSGKTIPSPGAAMFWFIFAAPNALASQASGGMQACIGSSGANFQQWYVRGADTYQYGGWVCIPVDPAVSESTHTGTPSGTKQFFGGVVKGAGIAAVSKGNPWGIDAIRYGRCEARIVGGTTPDAAATFDGFAAVNDTEANRWGLIQAVQGGYLMQGLAVIGYGGACRFTDSNKSMLIANTEKVISSFNAIEVRNASSVVTMNAISFTALGTTSRGTWITTDNATVNLTGCTFTDMGAFGFQSNTTATSCTFRRCDTITPVGGKLLGCTIDASRAATNTSAVVWNNSNPSSYLDNCAFIAGATANHAIQFPTDCPDAISLPGVTFSGYNSSDNQDGSAIHVLRTTGQVTITCSALPSVRSAGATIVKVGTSVTVTVWAKDIDGNNVDSARILLKAANATGPFPFEETVTIANSGTTATVAHTGHGMATSDKVLIDGASHWQNNGVFSITKTNDNEYTYTLPSAPGSNPTGTIKSTFVALEGLTSSGFLSTSREFSSQQPVTGWIRKAPTAGPWYKPAPLTGTIPTSGSLITTGIMISDV